MTNAEQLERMQSRWAKAATAGRTIAASPSWPSNCSVICLLQRAAMPLRVLSGSGNPPQHWQRI